MKALQIKVNHLKSEFTLFHTHSPALAIALYLMLGTFISLYPKNFLLPLITLLLLLTAHSKKDLLQKVTLITISLLYAHIFTPTPLPEKKLIGKGYFIPSQIRRIETNIKKFYGCSGILVHFETPDGLTATNLPTHILLPSLPSDTFGKTHLLVEGTLTPSTPNNTSLKLTSSLPVNHTFSPTRLRFNIKQKVRHLIAQTVKNPNNYALIASLSTGDVEGRVLKLYLQKLGLMHTLAISGFHFGWIAIILATLFQHYRHAKRASRIILFCITTYFLFIGPSPPAFRAYILALFFFSSYLFEAPTSSLNLLGVAILCSWLLDPLSITTASFQLSYLATFALLTLYSPIHHLTTKLIPKHTPSTICQMSLTQSLIYLPTIFLRKTLALNLTVQLALAPLVLYLFGTFSPASLLYNLFFPILLIPLLLILLITVPLFPFHHQLLLIADYYATFLNTLVFNAPRALLSPLYLPQSSPLILTLHSAVIIVAGILFYQRRRECLEFI